MTYNKYNKIYDMVDELLAIAHAGAAGHSHEEDDVTMKAIRGESGVPDTFYIDRIQKTLNELPWESFNRPNIALTRTKEFDQATTAALAKFQEIAEEFKSQNALAALDLIEEGKLREGADTLSSGANELKILIKTDDRYLEHTPGQEWTYDKKKIYLSKTIYPLYFPKPWQAKNMCSFVQGDKRGQFVIPTNEKEFGQCQTPDFNHFLMWGPNCPGCGLGRATADPRFIQNRLRYPDAFSYGKIRNRMKHQHWSPHVPSPGFMPYVAPPPRGSPYYVDPNNPDVEAEGVRFFDAQDEDTYYMYLDKYKQFKEEHGDEASSYNQMFADMRPDKFVPHRYKAPNEWSKAFYGRDTPLWPDGTMRPSAAQLKEIIRERGLSTKASNLQDVADRIRKIY